MYLTLGTLRKNLLGLGGFEHFQEELLKTGSRLGTILRPPPGDTEQCLETSWVVTNGESDGVVGLQYVEAWDTAKILQCPEQPPTTKNFPAQIGVRSPETRLPVLRTQYAVLQLG